MWRTPASQQHDATLPLPGSLASRASPQVNAQQLTLNSARRGQCRLLITNRLLRRARPIIPPASTTPVPRRSITRKPALPSSAKANRFIARKRVRRCFIRAPLRLIIRKPARQSSTKARPRFIRSRASTPRPRRKRISAAVAADSTVVALLPPRMPVVEAVRLMPPQAGLAIVNLETVETPKLSLRGFIFN